MTERKDIILVEVMPGIDPITSHFLSQLKEFWLADLNGNVKLTGYDGTDISRLWEPDGNGNIRIGDDINAKSPFWEHDGNGNLRLK